MDEYNPRQLSTYALTLFRKEVKLDDEGDDGSTVVVDFWDTAGADKATNVCFHLLTRFISQDKKLLIECIHHITIAPIAVYWYLM